VGDKGTPQWLKNLLRLVDYFGRLQTVWKIFVALLATIGVALKFPSDPLKWLYAAAAFFGTLAIVDSARRLYGKIERRKHPHSLEMTPHGGVEGVLNIKHSGESAEWSIEGRIVEALGGHYNPNSAWFQCILWKDNKSGLSVKLADGEWATIDLARFPKGEWGGGRTTTHILVQIGSYDNYVPVDHTGVCMEFVARSQPPTKSPVVRKFIVKRNEQDAVIDVGSV
jgi:hypothetical protein